MTINDYIATVRGFVTSHHWNELNDYNTIIRELLKADPGDNTSDLSEVKAELGALRDLIITNHQEAIMANEELNTKLNAKIDEVTAKFDEVKAAIVHEIEQLAAAGSGGTNTGLSVEQVDAAVARLEALAGTMQTSLDTMKADDVTI